jgi:hypothetical protein
MTPLRFCFGLRTLLLLVLLVAIVSALWRTAPSPDLAVTVRSNFASLNGQRIPLHALSENLRSEAQWRRLWLRDCIVHLNVEDLTKVKPLQDSISLAGASVQTVRVDREVTSRTDALAVLNTLADAKVPLRTIMITEDNRVALELSPLP